MKNIREQIEAFQKELNDIQRDFEPLPSNKK